MKQWKRWIREDLKGLGLFLVLAGGLLYAILFWFGYHLTYNNTILPGGNFWLVGGEILLTGIVAAAVLAVLFRALSGGFCRTETPTVMPENKCTSTSAPTADAAEYDHEKDGQTATGNERKKEKSGIWRTRYASFIEKKYAFFVLWAVIFLLWIPFWLSSYPGIFSYDSNLQFNWYFTDYRSAHHPLVHTWMLGGLVDLGHTLFGSYQAGAVLYALTQMVIMSALFAGICLYPVSYTHLSSAFLLRFYGLMNYHVLMLLNFVLTTVIVWVISAAMTKWVEQPWNRLLNKIWK